MQGGWGLLRSGQVQDHTCSPLLSCSMKRAASLNYLHKSSDASFEVSTRWVGLVQEWVLGWGLCSHSWLEGPWPVVQAVKGTVGRMCSVWDPIGGVNPCRGALLLCGAGATLPSQEVV